MQELEGAQRRHLASEPRLGVPALSQLEDEGLIEAVESEARGVVADRRRQEARRRAPRQVRYSLVA